MKRILLLTAAALALTACGHDGPVDDSVSNAAAPIEVPAIANDVKAVQGLQALSNRQLTEAENKCIDSNSDTCEKPIDDEWHRRGWCAYDATGARKPHCTAAEIKADEEAEAGLDNFVKNAKPAQNVQPLNLDADVEMNASND